MPLYVREPYVKLDLELNLEEGEIPEPEHMRACFFASDGGGLYNTQFVGSDGGNLSVASGSYTLLVYSFGTEYIQIRGESSLETIEAFTSDITVSKHTAFRRLTGTKAGENAPIFYAPDYLLVAMEASTEPATLWFPIEVDKEKAVLNASFNTFGVLPGGSETYIHFVVRNSGGQEVTFSKDISEQLAAPEHRITVDDEITIPKPSGPSGFSPEVDPWEEEIRDVPIG